MKGCVVWVSCRRWPYWNNYWFRSIDFSRDLPDIDLDLEGCWTTILLPQGMGSQELHWRLFLIDFMSPCCTIYHINLVGRSQQSQHHSRFNGPALIVGWLHLWYNPFAAVVCNLVAQIHSLAACRNGAKPGISSKRSPLLRDRRMRAAGCTAHTTRVPDTWFSMHQQYIVWKIIGHEKDWRFLALNRLLLFCEETEMKKSLYDSSVFPWEVMFFISISHFISLR